MQMVEPRACVAFFSIDTAASVAESLATVADRLGTGTIIHDCKEAVTSRRFAPVRSAYYSTLAAQLRHSADRLGERPCLLRLDRHTRMAYPWSCAAQQVTFCPLARRSDTPTRATARAQGTDREPPKLAHVRQPMTEVINPAWGFLARSKRGTRLMPAWLFGGTRQRRIQFCASGWQETKKGAAVWWRSPDDRTWL